MIAKRLPDAAPEVKRRALAYVLSFFLAFFIFTMTVALYRARRKSRSEQFETRIYFQVSRRLPLSLLADNSVGRTFCISRQD